MALHKYQLKVHWTGNNGTGTDSYLSYRRDHIISAEGKASIAGSSDVVFRGDKAKYNPEELLVASLSSCHMLWFLHLCAEHGVIVVDYTDEATGTMAETKDGGGCFTEVMLHPVVTIVDEAMKATTNALHEKANKLCFIANSCNFPVRHEAACLVK